MRCHTSSLNGKFWNLISSNLVAGVNLPASWLDNRNVHRFLNLERLPTPALPKSISLIFLLAELSWRAPIPIVNPLLYTVCIFGGRWGEHSYLDTPKNNKETDWFWNRLLSLCWLVHNVMTNLKCAVRGVNEWSYKLKVFWKNKWWV